jgi:hypothetical protein
MRISKPILIDYARRLEFNQIQFAWEAEQLRAGNDSPSLQVIGGPDFSGKLTLSYNDTRFLDYLSAIGFPFDEAPDRR